MYIGLDVVISMSLSHVSQVCRGDGPGDNLGAFGRMGSTFSRRRVPGLLEGKSLGSHLVGKHCYAWRYPVTPTQELLLLPTSKVATSQW